MNKRWLSTVLFTIFSASIACASTVTVGNSIINRGTLDSASTAYVWLTGFGGDAIGKTLSTWSYYAGSGASGRSITPLLLEFTSGEDYTLRAIGETQALSSGSAHTDLASNLQEGSASINNANFYFGWKDGTQTIANQGVITWSSAGGGNSALALSGNSSQNITGSDIRNTLTFGNTALGNRTYSFQANAIPEINNTAILMGVSILLCIYSVKRKNA